MSLSQEQDGRFKKETTRSLKHRLGSETPSGYTRSREPSKFFSVNNQDHNNDNNFMKALSPIINTIRRKISTRGHFTSEHGQFDIHERRQSAFIRQNTPSNTGTNTLLSHHMRIKKPRWKRKLELFLNCTPVLIVTSLITIYALFGSDIQIAWTRPNVDLGFNVSQTIIFAFFVVEFCLNCLCMTDYIFSFFFWLDLIAAISFIQDLDYIMNEILGYGPTTISTKSSIQAAKAVQKVAQATRATRVLRVVRIIRLIRMIKIYKNIYTVRENKARKLEEEKRKELEKKEKELIEASSSNSNSSKSGSDSNSKKMFLILNSRTGTFVESTRIKSSSGVNTEANLYNSPIITTTINLLPGGKDKENKEDIEQKDKELKGKEKDKAKDKDQVKDKGANQINNDCLSPSRRRRNTNKKLSAAGFMVSTMNRTEDDEDEEEIIKESKISKIITEANTKKVIILILILLIIFPILSEDFYTDDSSITYNLLAEYISSFTLITGSFNLFKSNTYFSEELIDKEFPPVNVTINGTLFYRNARYSHEHFRYKELRHAYSSNGLVHVTYSILTETQMTGWLNIMQTVFVCLCLSIFTVSLENLAKKLLLNPLEIMIEIVDTVAKDPMNATNIENLKNGIKAEVNDENDNDNGNTNTKGKRKKDEMDNYEMNVIKTAIIKISALLAIGFGEAGGEIIKKNLSVSQDLNTKLKGKKKQAIFGFCDIRQFEKLTLALEEGIMLFVNQIAEIVHSSVDRFGGATNKNIGEAFLNVWKFYNETPIKGNKKNGEKKVQKKDNLLRIDPSNPQVGIIADMSVLGFLRVLLKINKSLNILRYRSNEKIIELIPNFKLSMGFGLHLGYGIEGAVGSTYKFDASYLSPNVNIAARLESATRQFGLPLLFSGVLYKLLTPELKQICRFVDCVKVKGSLLPLELYTIDLNLNLTPEQEKKKISLSNKDKKNFYADKKDMLKREVNHWGSITKLILSRNSYLEMLKTSKTDEFYVAWDNGIKNYLNGNFKKANQYFAVCLKIDSTDGPSKTLINYIESCGGKAPENWEGTRELLAK